MSRFEITETPEFLSLKSEIQKKVGRILKIARLTKRLSLNEAADLTTIDCFTLKALEEGSARQELCVISSILTSYNAGIEDLQDFANEVMFNKSLRELRSRKRINFSVVGATEKPWDQLPGSLAEIRRQNFSE